MDNNIIKMFVINFLFYNKKCVTEEAEKIFRKNEEHFVRVFKLLGSKFLNKIAEEINGSSKM